MSQTRSERDSMGTMQVPADALYGAQTARAVENFPISGWRMPREFIAALGAVKLACATVNKRARRLEPEIADAIIAASMEVMDGRHDAHFPVDVFQTGSGTSTNMNANEVIANRAMQLLGPRRAGVKIHPNDHVNMSQSSNDVIPTALHVAATLAIETLLSSLMRLARSLERKAKEFDTVVKIGRTHLMDAVPVRLGQEFAGYADQVTASYWGLLYETEELYKNLAIGGTAVGTGLNAPKNFGRDVCRVLRKHIGLFKRGGSAGWGETKGRFAQLGAKDAVVSAAGALKRTALVLGKIASDIRLMGSGPRCGLGELVLPAVQPGSSIMPGKVNPVICESVIQVACQVVGCDAAITAGAMGGVGSILELNVAMPMIAWNLLTASKLLTNAATTFEEKCVRGLKANAARCEELVEQSLAMVTALAPKLGYDLAAEIAKEAMESGKTIREICIANKVLPTAELNRLLDARKQTGK